MAKRKAISKKTRFEVFKRDSFQCQYCGLNAPEVVLEVDHIDPVSRGGANTIVNLITACLDCNRGKGATRLSQKDTINKQYKEIALAAERREQIEAMHKWCRDLALLEEKDVDFLVAHFTNTLGVENYEMSNNNRLKLKQYYKRFRYDKIIDAIEISIINYIPDHGNIHEYKIDRAIKMIGGICYNKQKKEAANG